MQSKTVRELAAMAPEDVRGVAEALADEIEFMRRTLDELREHISVHGAVDLYRNGKQENWRESPAMKSYSALIPRYAALFKQLVGLLPDDSGELDELDQWLQSH